MSLNSQTGQIFDYFLKDIKPTFVERDSMQKHLRDTFRDKETFIVTTVKYSES